MKILFKIYFIFFIACLRLRHWKRVVVVERASGLGDIICCLPICQTLKQEFPKHLIVFATVRPYDRLLKYYKGIDAVYGTPPGYPVPQEKATWLVDRHYKPLTSDERQQGGQKLHLAHAFLTDCGLPMTNWQPRISIPIREQEAVARRFGFQPGEAIVAIHSGRSWPVRELPEELWREIVGKLKQQFGGRIIHFCTPAGQGDHRQAVYNLPGTQSLPENLDLIATAAILSQCRVLIGIDSGLLHLAGMLSIPTVGIFGAVNPQFRLPFGTPSKGVHASLPCSFCHHETPIKHWCSGCPYDIRCMQDISVDQVVEAAEKMLSMKAH